MFSSTRDIQGSPVSRLKKSINDKDNKVKKIIIVYSYDKIHSF